MKKLTLLFVALVTAVSAQVTSTFTAGYRSKDITFGRVSSDVAAYVGTAEVAVGSFRLGANVQNNLNLNDSSLYQIDLIGGYKFFSTLANVEFGTKYVTKGHPVNYDMKNHFRPFVEVGKDIFSIRAMMDLEAQTSNIEGALKHSVDLGLFGLKFIPSINVGYTDVNDALPHSKKEIKYTNMYYGGSADLTWKFISGGLYTVCPSTTKKYATGYRGGVALKF